MKLTYEQYISGKYDLLATGRDGEFRTTCPFCSNPDRKFYFRFQYSSFNCYHCQASGSLYKFIKDLHKDINVKDLNNGYYIKVNKVLDKTPVPLPSDFISLSNVTSYIGLQYMNYLYSRGLSLEHIHTYKFGYSPSLSYQLIIPVYNEVGAQVYYTTRLIRDDVSQEKVYNPTSSNAYYSKSDCMFNLHRYIGRSTLYLFEGVFSALSGTMCNCNSVALFGKVLSAVQLELLINCEFKDIVVCLDDDADEEAAALCLKLKPYFNVMRVCFPKDKDANDLLLTGELHQYLKSPKPFTQAQNIRNLLKKFKKS